MDWERLPILFGCGIATQDPYFVKRLNPVREALGDHIFEKFIENKRIEWDRYRAQVTNYELERYLSVL